MVPGKCPQCGAPTFGSCVDCGWKPKPIVCNKCNEDLFREPTTGWVCGPEGNFHNECVDGTETNKP